MAKSTTTIPITTRLGPIVAEVDADDLVHARGLKYATAKRWKESEPVEAWTNEIDCTKPAPICPQSDFEFDFILGEIVEHGQSEDCLTASIVAPLAAVKGETKLPVLVWIHGGANIAGGNDLDVFDTSALAKRGVVVVSIQYRLGVFGAFPIEGIAPPNLILMDQILALKWVHANIDKFGGDPSQITISGQSAGAAACYTLLLSEAADGLYSRALLISAPLGVPAAKAEFRKELSDYALTLLGDSPATKSATELLEIQKKILDLARKKGNTFAAFSPMLGEYPLPTDAERQARLTSIARRVELLTGWTADDCLPFVYMIPSIRRLSGIPYVGRWLMVAIGKFATNTIFKSKTNYMHYSFLAAGGVSTTFCVEWFPTGSKWRACHCVEMPLMFGTWDLWKSRPLCQGTIPAATVEKTVKTLGVEVRELFTAFARGELHSHSGKHVRINEHFEFAKL